MYTSVLLFEQQYPFQALLAYDDTTMAITFRSEKTAKMLDKKRKRIEEMGGRVIIPSSGRSKRNFTQLNAQFVNLISRWRLILM